MQNLQQMTDEYKEIQKQFLQKVEDLIPRDTSLVFELSDLLGLSTDSVYRRMRGETLMTFDEILRICNHYNVSFDAFSKAETGMVTFRYADTSPTFAGFISYLQKMYEDLVRIASFPGCRIIYAAEDIPIFYHYGFPNIASFKFFYWLKSVSNLPELQQAQYDPELIDPAIRDVALKIFDLYMRIPSVEIWTDNTIVGAVKQIEYYWDSGFFKSAQDALLVCESLETELNGIRRMAEKSRKGSEESNSTIPENYSLYYSDVEVANNCVLVEMGQHKAVYLGHLTFFTLSTTNAAYGNVTSVWMDTLIRKSTLISGVSEKQRLRFFKKASGIIADLKKKIESGE